MAKSTKAEVEYRLNRVYRLMCKHATTSEVIDYCAREWGVGAGQAKNYVRRVRERISKDWELDRRQFTADLLTQYADLAKSARANGNDHIAIGALNAMARIAGITN
jgi:hypothetical protein